MDAAPARPVDEQLSFEPADRLPDVNLPDLGSEVSQRTPSLVAATPAAS
jgi:hypothetical protein